MADIPLAGSFAEAGDTFSVIAADLEQDSDIVLARLLEAAVSAHNTTQRELTGAIEHFLKQTFNAMLSPQTPGSGEVIAFL